MLNVALKMLYSKQIESNYENEKTKTYLDIFFIQETQ